MSIGTVVNIFLALVIFSVFYIVLSVGANAYNEKANEQISDGDVYSQNRKDSLDGTLNAWYGLPVAVIFLLIVYGILEAVAEKNNEV